MENDYELPIDNMLPYHVYSSPDFSRTPLVIFFGNNSLYLSAELKYQIVFHLLNSLFAFLLISIVTPILLPVFFFAVLSNLIRPNLDNLYRGIKMAPVLLLGASMAVFNVLFFIPNLPVVFGTIGLVSWILSGVFVVGWTIFNVVADRKKDPIYIGAYKKLNADKNEICFIEAKDNSPRQDIGSNIMEIEDGDVSLIPLPASFFDNPKKEIYQKVPVSEVSFRDKMCLRYSEIMKWND